MAHEAVRSPSRIITTIAAVLAVVALTGAQSSCEAQRAKYESSKAKKSNSQVQDSKSQVEDSKSNAKVQASVVEYSVTSDATIESVTYLDADGTMVTKSNVGRSWSGTGPADHGTVLIQATTGNGSSMIKCMVRVRGQVVQRASAVGGGDTTVVCKTSY